MVKRIEAHLLEADVVFTKKSGEQLKADGNLVFGFECPNCLYHTKFGIKYDKDKEEPLDGPIRRCEVCDDEYLIDCKITIVSEVQDKEGVNLYRETKKIIDEVKS